ELYGELVVDEPRKHGPVGLRKPVKASREHVRLAKTLQHLEGVVPSLPVVMAGQRPREPVLVDRDAADIIGKRGMFDGTQAPTVRSVADLLEQRGGGDSGGA